MKLKDVYLVLYGISWSLYFVAYNLKWVFLFVANPIFTFNLLQFYQMLRNSSTKIKIKFLRYEQSSQCKSSRDSSVSYASAAAKTDESSSSWSSSFMWHSALSFPFKSTILYLSFEHLDIMFHVDRSFSLTYITCL